MEVLQWQCAGSRRVHSSDHLARDPKLENRQRVRADLDSFDAIVRDRLLDGPSALSARVIIVASLIFSIVRRIVLQFFDGDDHGLRYSGNFWP